MPELAVIDAGDVAELGSLGRALGEAYKRRVEWYRQNYGDRWPEALAEHDAAAQGEFDRRAETEPAEQVTFSSLADLAQIDPDAAHVAWLRVRAEARDQLASGYAAAEVIDTHANAWERAQFLAVRDALLDQWPQPNKGEVLLIHMLAQAYATCQHWMALLTVYTTRESTRHKTRLECERSYEPVRLSDSEAMEQAAAMADRFNRIYLRTLRQLRDLRRYAPAVTINNPAQVNMGQQQVNVAEGG